MKKILVANRGEIALRVMKSARKMGIETVAVFSEADRNSPHVIFADEAVYIGPSPSSESYLKMDKIIEAAKNRNVQAIHPGYGFLSENDVFAQKVKDAGLIFIGPSPYSIRTMGDKLAAKNAVKKYEIPMTPGTDKAIDKHQEALIVAREIGFPILVKAAAGGGGKGMRLVAKESDLEEQMKRAISEAVSAFGDGSVFIEKYIASPRHIEIQILGDLHGNFVHLFERECSIQRRHQKVIEEAPSVYLDPKLRKKMGNAAVDVARSCNYQGAGTVEFLLDENKKFYFLEMNTRLQVEHPVTELITGYDLVEQQIRIARGEKLNIAQEEVKLNGHAIELRVYAEDPLNNFLPSIGRLDSYKIPSGEGIRIDDGYEEGMEIPIYYDPLISKLISYGKNRDEALSRLKKAINEYEIRGIHTTLSFGKYVLEHEQFQSGDFNTHFVGDHFEPQKLIDQHKEEARIASLISARMYLNHHDKITLPENGNEKWRQNRR